MATVKLADIHKSYHKTEVIHGIDLDVQDGEFIVIVGPSGCGKSTLLRMVAGLESVTSGNVEIDGRVVNALEPRERDVAMVFQNYALYPHMNVFRNMSYGLRIAKIPAAEIEARVNKAAAMLELSDLLNRKPAQLSGGQRQRVAMGRAIVREPRVFLFDEPLSNLDAKLRVQMRLEIKQLQAELGTTTLYVTHDQTEAMTMADRLVVMNDGVAEQIDDPMTIFERPQTSFVAGFIGTPPMNLLHGAVQSNGKNGLVFDCGNNLRLPIPDSVPSDVRDGAQCVLGIRPDALAIRENSNEVEQQGWSAKIGIVEPLGSDSLFHCQFDSTTNASETITVRGDTNRRIRFGDAVSLAFDSESLHWFDADDGRRLS